jgi:hypothetical protein
MSEATVGGEALSKGEAVSGDELAKVMRREEATVVLLAGPVKCGKTTVLVALYELFNEGPVGGLMFAGSETLAGFERICHLGRAASGERPATTGRTNPSDIAGFLHLRVADRSTERITSVLASDVTGEAFTEARDVSDPLKLPSAYWKRANVLCVLLDGEKIASSTKRHAVRAGARTTLSGILGANLLRPDCRLSVITTKWDLCHTSDSQRYVADTEAELESKFAARFQSFSTFHIAARPRAASVPFAYGVPSLLTHWIARDEPRLPLARPHHRDGSALSDHVAAVWQTRGAVIAETFDVIR